MIVEDESINRKDISEAVQEAVSRTQKTREHKAAHLHTLFIDSAAFPIYTSGKNVFLVGILHLGQKEDLADIRGRLVEGFDAWLREIRGNILVEISDPTTLSFLIGGEDVIPLDGAGRKAYIRVVEQILGEELRWFLAMGSQVDETEAITDSWQAARQVQKSLAYLGWNHVAFPEDLQGDHRLAMDMTVVDRFAEAVSKKEEEAAIALLDQVARELEQKQVYLSGDVRHVYYSLNLVIKQAELALRLDDMSKETGRAEADYFEHVETFAEMNGYLQNRLSGLFEGGEVQKSTYFITEIRAKYFKKITQTVILLPYFISWVVVGVFVFSIFNYETGLINTMINAIGGEKVNFYMMPTAWPIIICAFNAWKWTGYNSVIYIAAVTGVYGEINEAAEIDGATIFQRIRYITLPSIRPTLVTMVLLQVGRILRGDFEMFYQIVGNNGQLFNATDVIDTYVFRSLITNPDIGMTAAATFYQSVLCFAIIMIVNTVVKKIDEDYVLF